MDRPAMTLTAVVLGTPDPRKLARFYQDLLGWTVRTDEPDWVTLAAPGGGAGLSFQEEVDHVPPAWPASPGDQQMMMHLDIEVENLATACEHALGCGATLAEFQPQQNVRVLLDPDGHPFCIWVQV
jgi:catechol 2,3-dioxygenase-like lactoylglutathione lyase family enzyme